MVTEYGFSPRAAEKRNARRAANFAGYILIALIAGQFFVQLFSAAAEKFLPSGALTHPIGSMIFGMVEYFLYFALPVLAVALIVRPGINPFPLRRVPRGTYPMAVFGGMALSLLANILANVIVQFLVLQGVSEPQFPETYDPSVINLVLNLLSMAVMPAFFEEIAFRGYVLGALRPYGDKLALILSSALFGLIHGNIKQVPFAFVLGLVFGWLAVQTNSLLPSIVLHFTNNAFSVVAGWLDQFTGNSGMPTILLFTLFCLFGATVTAVVFWQRKPHRQDLLRPVGNGVSFLSVGERTWAVLTAPALVLGGGAWIAVMVYLMM